MSFTLTASKGNGGGTEKCPAGNHLAVLVAVIDMGTQENSFQGQDVKWQRRAYFVWELVGEQISGTKKNHVIGVDLTLSLNEKAKLRKWVEARTGKVIPEGSEFDVSKELGQPCMLNVVEKNGYPRIDGVAAVPAAFVKSMPPATYPLTALDLDSFIKGTPVPEFVPWMYGSPLADHIKACREIGGAKPQPKRDGGAAGVPNSPNGIATGTNDPIPF
jgi:hypothetical protein